MVLDVPKAFARRTMISKLGAQVGKTILVSVPSLFPDGKCQPLRLVGVESSGLWLEGDGLADRLLPDHLSSTASAGAIAFIPFSQIVSVLVAPSGPSSAAVPALSPPNNRSPAKLSTTVSPTKSLPEETSESSKKKRNKRN